MPALHEISHNDLPLLSDDIIPASNRNKHDKRNNNRGHNKTNPKQIAKEKNEYLASMPIPFDSADRKSRTTATQRRMIRNTINANAAKYNVSTIDSDEDPEFQPGTLAGMTLSTIGCNKAIAESIRIRGGTWISNKSIKKQKVDYMICGNLSKISKNSQVISHCKQSGILLLNLDWIYENEPKSTISQFLVQSKQQRNNKRAMPQENTRQRKRIKLSTVISYVHKVSPNCMKFHTISQHRMILVKNGGINQTRTVIFSE